MSTPRVFVSHSSSDRSVVERDIIPLLQSKGILTWYSKDDIATATDWEKKIRDGLTSSDWFLLVMSPRSEASEWVRTELHWAMTHRVGRIVPVMIELCDPTNFHLGLQRIQFVDFRGGVEGAGDKLLSVWKPTSGTRSRSIIRNGQAVGKWLRTAFVFAGCIGFIALATFAVVIFSRDRNVAKNEESPSVDGQVGNKDDSARYSPKQISERSAEELGSWLRKSVLVLRSGGESNFVQCTGFFISDKGRFLVPSYSLKEEPFVAKIGAAESQYPARLLRRDDKIGLALLQVDLDYQVTAIPVADVQTAPGTSIVAVGFARDQEWFTTEGTILGSVKEDESELLAANLATFPGMGGGPVLNRQGELVGMIIGRNDLGGYAALLPLKRIIEFLDKQQHPSD